LSCFIAFSEDEYQACSGIGHGADKKTVVVKRKDPAGAEAHLYFEAFCGTRPIGYPGRALLQSHNASIPFAGLPEQT
jgi:hypothetical protein